MMPRRREQWCAESGRFACFLSTTQVGLAQVGSGQRAVVKQNSAHVGLLQAGALQGRVGHHRELHLGPDEAGVLQACRNEVCAAQAGPG